MIDGTFLLRCDECDERGLASRLWLRASVEVKMRHEDELHHYVQCLNCGTRMKSCHDAMMESVDDAEWQRFVDEEGARANSAAASASRAN